jgi:hypothetical protein
LRPIAKTFRGRGADPNAGRRVGERLWTSGYRTQRLEAAAGEEGVVVVTHMGRHILDATVGGDDARPFLATVSKANKLHGDFFS